MLSLLLVIDKLSSCTLVYSAKMHIIRNATHLPSFSQPPTLTLTHKHILTLTRMDDKFILEQTQGALRSSIYLCYWITTNHFAYIYLFSINIYRVETYFSITKYSSTLWCCSCLFSSNVHRKYWSLFRSIEWMNDKLHEHCS